MPQMTRPDAAGHQRVVWRRERGLLMEAAMDPATSLRIREHAREHPQIEAVKDDVMAAGGKLEGK